jgi:hypothetical protein
MIRIVLLCVLALGCSGGDAGNADKSGERVFSGQKKALDKAKSVEQTLEDAAAR